MDWVSDYLQLGRALAGVTEVLRNGARALLAQAVHGNFCSNRHADEVSDDGRRRLVRHGHLPEREIMDRHRPCAWQGVNGGIVQKIRSPIQKITSYRS